jgi:hypothetical protein
MKKPNRKIRKTKCFERKIKHVTEIGWAVWHVDKKSACLLTSTFKRRKSAIGNWLIAEGFKPDNYIGWKVATGDGYRCLRTTARGEL